jgi:NADPH-dependent glutamate synthase beta subunit-like oxidoreductase
MLSMNSSTCGDCFGSVATGLNKGRELNISGAHLAGVNNGIDFLINVNLGYSKIRIAVPRKRCCQVAFSSRKSHL